MVKQKVKQLQIEGLSKFTEPKWVFLKRLSSALTLTRPHPTSPQTPQLVLSDTDT